MTQSPPEKTTFYIVDASGYIFRSFCGMPPLTSPEGVPTNALFGFLKTLNSLIQQEKPTIWPLPSIRREELPP